MNVSKQELEARVCRAVDNFMAGYGCCQSVVAAFSDLYGLDELTAKRIAAGCGGGVGRLRMMCGAVSGIVMLVGLDCGQTEGSDREGKSACYKVVQQLLAKVMRKPPPATRLLHVRLNTTRPAPALPRWRAQPAFLPIICGRSNSPFDLSQEEAFFCIKSV